MKELYKIDQETIMEAVNAHMFLRKKPKSHSFFRVAAVVLGVASYIVLGYLIYLWLKK